MNNINHVDKKKSILDRLKDGQVIIGDGSYITTLERRGYVLGVHFTPEVVVEHPNAVRELAKEFARAGADITQTCTYFSSGTNLERDGDHGIKRVARAPCEAVNKQACEIANEISNEWGTFVAGAVSQSEVYLKTRNREDVRRELGEAFRAQVDQVDVFFVEYFKYVEEMVWAIELAKEFGKPIAATMCMGPNSDGDGVPTKECAKKMIQSGADIIGTNCLFDPFVALDTMKHFKEAVDEIKEGEKKPFLMMQPVGFMCPDGGSVWGYMDTPEFPFALESRHITRWEAARYAREAYELGVRVIGGCCGFESYHIRAMAEELSKERGGQLPVGSHESDYDLRLNAFRSKVRGTTHYDHKWNRDFWMNLHPCSGRPCSSAVAESIEHE